MLKMHNVLYLVHNGQQFTEGKPESMQRVAVLKVQCETALKLGHQHALPIGATCFVSVRKKPPMMPFSTVEISGLFSRQCMK